MLMKNYSNAAIVGIFLLIGISTKSTALQFDQTSGLYYDEGIKNGSPWKAIYRFSSYSTGTTTEIFTGSNTSGLYAGMVDITGYNKKDVSITIDRLAAGTTTVKLYTCNGTPTVWSEILSKELYGTTTYGFPIMESSEKVRIGISDDATGGIVTLREFYSK